MFKNKKLTGPRPPEKNPELPNGQSIPDEVSEAGLCSNSPHLALPVIRIVSDFHSTV